MGSVLKTAWSNVRLDTIRVVVRQTIASLEELDPRQALGREPSQAEIEVGTGSVRAALDSCCDELREGCGLPTTTGSSVRVQSTRAAGIEWARSYSTALDGYRDAACRVLEASLT